MGKSSQGYLASRLPYNSGSTMLDFDAYHSLPLPDFSTLPGLMNDCQTPAS